MSRLFFCGVIFAGRRGRRPLPTFYQCQAVGAGVLDGPLR